MENKSVDWQLEAAKLIVAMVEDDIASKCPKTTRQLLTRLYIDMPKDLWEQTQTKP